MKKVRASSKKNLQNLKVPSGIDGFDEITFGGLPKYKTTLLCGNAGCGKTIFGLEYLIRGAANYHEPGVFVSFEETVSDLKENVRSLGFNLKELEARKLVQILHIEVNRDDITESGEYDLSGLFIRLEHLIRKIKAKRVVLDTLEALFSGFNNTSILRAELRRLFQWLKTMQVTTVITAERGADMLTKQGLEEYVSDCVILLDHRVINQISTRRLRIIKYRGSTHGTNEYPFLIDENGISVLPVTSILLDHQAKGERISSGVDSLNEMLGGKGFYRGSTVLTSGAAGTGKSSLAGAFALEACKRGERCIYFAFEESPSQIVRNMKTIGFDFANYLGKQLRIYSTRPSLYGLEMHLVTMHKLIKEFQPSVVVIDPVTNLINIGERYEVTSMLTRLIDYLKINNITAYFTALVHGSDNEMIDERISSLVDTWLLVREIETNGERNRGIYVIKSRGMNHSNQVREFTISRDGLKISPVYIGEQGVLIGSAKDFYEAKLANESKMLKLEHAKAQAELAEQESIMELRINALRSNFELKRKETQRKIHESLINEKNLKLIRTNNEDMRSTKHNEQ